MSSNDQSFLDSWKFKRFSDEVPFGRVISSIDNRRPIATIRNGRSSSRSTVFSVATKQPLVFSHAGVIAWTSDLDSGNYVAEGVDLRRKQGYNPHYNLQRNISSKCEITLALDTAIDRSMLLLGQKLDRFIVKTGFLRGANVPRRKWQSFSNDNGVSRFLMTSPLFERKTVFNSVQEPLSYDLDRSIEDALIGQKWFANPDRVRFFSYEDNGLVHLKNTLVPYLASGDVVWFSFTMQYVVNNVSWGPDLQLVDVVRVGRFEGKVEHPVGIRRGLQAGLITPISDAREDYHRARVEDDVSLDGSVSESDAGIDVVYSDKGRERPSGRQGDASGDDVLR